jgi:hypothetical protein
MKREPKKLKLTKLTVANLERAKGGKAIPYCACDVYLNDGSYNRDYRTSWLYQTFCCTP